MRGAAAAGGMGPSNPSWAAALALGALLLGLGAPVARADLAARARAEAEAATRPPAREREGAYTVDELLIRALAAGPQVLLQRQELAFAQARAAEARASRMPRLVAQGQLVHQTPLVSGLDLDIYGLTQAVLGSYPTTSIPTLPDTTGGADPTLPLPAPTFDLDDAWGLPSDIVTLGFKVQQPVFTSGRIRHGVRAAGLAAEMEGMNLLGTGAEVSHLFWQATLGLFTARSSAALLDEMAVEMTQLVADVSGLRDQGLVTETEVLAAAASLARLQAEAQGARAGEVAALEGLRQIAAVTEAEPLELEGDLQTLPIPLVPDLDALADLALSCRADVDVSRVQAALGVAQARATAAQLSLRPTLAFTLEGGLRGLAIPVVQTNWMQEWGTYVQAAAVLSVPLYDGGSARAQVDQAKARATQAYIGDVLTVEMVRSQVRQAHAELRAAVARYAFAEAELAARSEAHRIATARYAADDLPRADHLEAWLAFAAARAAHLSALQALQLAAVELDSAAGLLPRAPEEVRGARCGGGA